MRGNDRRIIAGLRLDAVPHAENQRVTDSSTEAAAARRDLRQVVSRGRGVA